jgi:tricarballylate dehydrogenase
MQSNTDGAYGRRAFDQPDHEVFLIFDEKTSDLVFSSGPSEPMESDSLETLVRRLGIDDVETTLATIEEFNEACDPGEFNPHDLDGNKTLGIDPPKSNWALPIDEPPFYGFPTTGGITFTFGGLQINANAEVLDTGFDPIPGLYAAGNSTGELFYYNYPGGSGQINAAVYDRIAGENAAEYVTSQ